MHRYIWQEAGTDRTSVSTSCGGRVLRTHSSGHRPISLTQLPEILNDGGAEQVLGRHRKPSGMPAPPRAEPTAAGLSLAPQHRERDLDEFWRATGRGLEFWRRR